MIKKYLNRKVCSKISLEDNKAYLYVDQNSMKIPCLYEL